ncbi:MAG: 2-amino-4-hydroxy-6-hydroxymethyldihydropteridine diphosphokinase [Gammaproteobacteria bacterium]|nr:2-amino-4-hydroxy-6-hydroxymethyldihydropteridine diphosphokinase [Gammaproteobacteria bacterium]MCW8923294.1 2-amino-4-hydroxy-6-hydroxymethyldihydropteridine diphosphokinase [Gammaproteobacteria bacterium]
MAEQVYIGLGSNLEQPDEQISRAVASLKQLPECCYIADSGLFKSQAMLPEGGEAQHDYYNAVVLIETSLEPLILLDHLQVIENNQGRERDYRWAPRTIDLDMLLYGQMVMHEPRLQLPHYDISGREFVLYPLQRLCEKLQQIDLEIPGHGMLSEMIKSCPRNELVYVGEIA